jgi:phage terminase small subunit
VTNPTQIGRDDGELGPAMQELNERQRLFVWACLTGMDNTQAAAAAGYAPGNRDAQKVEGYRQSHNAAVQAALVEEGRKYLRKEAVRSFHTLVFIRDNPGSEDKDRLKAALAIMDRGGFNAITEHKVEVTRKMNDAESMAEMLRVCRELGYTREQAALLLPRDLLEKYEGPVIDVKSEPVEAYLGRDTSHLADTPPVVLPAEETDIEDLLIGLPPETETELHRVPLLTATIVHPPRE